MTVDLRRIMHKRLYHTGSGLRPRSVADKGKMARALEADGLAAAGRRQGEAGHRLDLSAARGRGRPCPDGDQRTHRQDRADHLGPGGRVFYGNWFPLAENASIAASPEIDANLNFLALFTRIVQPGRCCVGRDGAVQIGTRMSGGLLA